MSERYAANSIRLNFVKTRVLQYPIKTNVLSCENQLCPTAITFTSSIKDLGAFSDTTFFTAMLFPYFLNA
jgi:hypothetical protein